MSLGTLVLEQPRFVGVVDDGTELDRLDIIARVKTANMVAIVAPFGIEAEALGELIKDIWGIDSESDLPIDLPMHVRFKLKANK
jgi:hypothetical protein